MLLIRTPPHFQNILSRSVCDYTRGFVLVNAFNDRLQVVNTNTYITIAISHFSVHYSTQSSVFSLLLDVSW
jgi:hypothetical protein